MPLYCYKCVCGKTAEVAREMAESGKRKRCKCKKYMKRDVQAENNGHKSTPGTYPFASTAAGIDVDEIPEMRKIDAAGGCVTDYTTGPNGGDPIFTGPQHRKKYLKLHGLFDRNAGYTDPTPRSNIREPRRKRRA